MASVRRRNASPYWYACVTLPGGRRRHFSTRKTDRKEALAIAQATELSLQKGRDRQHFLGLLGSLWDEVSPEGPSIRAADYFARWLGVREPEVSVRTAAKYRQVAAEASAAWPARSVDEIGQQDVAALRDQWGADHAVGTANQKLRILKAMLADAWRDGAAARNEAAKVRPLRSAPGRSRRPFSLTELQALLEAADDDWRGMILLGIYTGQRLSDLGRLTWAAVHLERKEISFRASKTGRLVLLPIADPLHEWLMCRPAVDSAAAPLFPALACERTQTLSQRFYKLMVTAGLAPARLSWKGHKSEKTKRRAASVIGFHSLRHTATSMLKAAGVAEAVAMEIIGHDSPAVSQHYTSLSQDTLRDALRRLPRLPSA